MNEQVLNDSLARRFLLGQLPPEEQGRIEELAFQDPDTFAFLQSAEDELVDEFLYDELSSDEKALFQKNFLAKPGRRENVKMARALKQYLDEDDPVVDPVPVPVKPVPPKPLPLFQWFRLGALTAPLVVAAIVIMSGVGVLVAIKMKQSGEGPQNGPQQAQIQPSPTPSPISSPSASPVPSPSSSPVQHDNQNKRPPAPRQPSAPSFAVTFLPMPVLRSDVYYQKVPRQTGPIVATLPIVSVTSYQNYEAVLISEGNTIHTWPDLKTRQRKSTRAVEITIEPALLSSAQRYRIDLNGIAANGETQPIHSYYFELTD